MAAAYKAIWIQGDEVFAEFEVAGLDDAAAIDWLGRAFHDHGYCMAHDADPEHDLFRLPEGARPWPAEESFRRGIDWSDLTIGAWYDGFLVPVPLQVSRPLLSQLLPKATPNKGKPGRKPNVDWPTIEDALRLHVQKHGLPDPENPPGWQWQSDAERWTAELLSSREQSASESTVREHVKTMLARIAEAGN